jgi:hypothetical protein
MSFTGYSDIFADRYGRSIAAADNQRRRDQESTQQFAGQVQSDLNQEAGGPVPPTMPDDGSNPQFDTGMDEEVNENVERTKNYLLEVSKKRLNQVADV